MKRKHNIKSRHEQAGGANHALTGNPIVQAFAQRLRQWRYEQSKTLRQVADDLGVSISIVSEWENCHRFPAAKTLQAVVEYTKVPAWAFFYPGKSGAVNFAGSKEPSRKA